jgi:hypothetical protein
MYKAVSPYKMDKSYGYSKVSRLPHLNPVILVGEGVVITTIHNRIDYNLSNPLPYGTITDTCKSLPVEKMDIGDYGIHKI